MFGGTIYSGYTPNPRPDNSAHHVCTGASPQLSYTPRREESDQHPCDQSRPQAEGCSQSHPCQAAQIGCRGDCKEETKHIEQDIAREFQARDLSLSVGLEMFSDSE